jgi:hypothetical protein
VHALSASFHFVALTLIPKLGKSPDASGSGKSLTPFARMHSVNFTALSRAVSVELAVAVLGVVFVVPADPAPPVLVPPQPALITTIIAITARAASGMSVLLMVSPLEC